MTFATKVDVDLNSLRGLRAQLTSRVGLVIACASGVVAWLALVQEPFSIELELALGASMLLGLSAYRLADRHLALISQLMLWGLAMMFWLALWQLSAPWLPYLSLLLVLTGAMLVPGSEFIIGVVTALMLAWLSSSGLRAYPLPILLGMIVLTATVAWLLVHSLYTALHWVWNAQQRAERLLAEVREHRAELHQALHSYQLANSRLRRAERELYFAHQQAEEARRLKEQFAANVSHELRTPLNLIHGFSEMMHRSPETYSSVEWSPNLRRDVYQIYRSSRHLLSMIDDILSLSRFEHSDFVLNREPTQLAELLTSTAEIVEDMFRTSPVELIVDTDQNLPLLNVDETRIRQVLLNLLTNALRLTEEGEVCLGAEKRGNDVLIWIHDTGPGIPADKLPHIFEEFYQLDLSLRHGHGGTGLGLAISRRFVEAHDGRVWAESEEGVGTTFYIALPLPEESLSVSRLHLSSAVVPSFAGTQPALLVVDPDPNVVALVRRHVRDHDVQQVETIEQIPDAVEQYYPRAIIRNIAQDEDPIQLPSLPVPIIDCVLPSQAWIRNEPSVKGVLAKPFTAQQLLHTLENLGLAGAQGHNLLIVDDDRGFCQLITRMLETNNCNYVVTRAYDGEQGLQSMRAKKPDLVMLDLVMPGMDGFALLEQIRNEPELASLPVLLLTATSYGREVDRQWGERVVIHRPGGLHPGEVLGWLSELVELLGPRHDTPTPRPTSVMSPEPHYG